MSDNDEDMDIEEQYEDDEEVEESGEEEELDDSVDEEEAEENEESYVSNEQTKEIPITSQEIEDLTKQLIEAKVELAFLRKRKKLLLEEIHRQCLEGELDPKKRLKPFYDKRKKLKIDNDMPSVEKV